MKTNKFTLMSLAFVGLLSFGSAAQAASLSLRHIDQLATSLERQANRFRYQTYRIHRFGPAARHLRQTAQWTAWRARRLRQLVQVDGYRGGQQPVLYGGRQPVSIRANRMAYIRREARQIDRLVHSMQDLVARMERRRPGGPGSPVARGPRGPINVQPISAPNQFGPGYGYGNPLRPIRFGLNRMEGTVHHLLRDLSIPCGGGRR